MVKIAYGGVEILILSVFSILNNNSTFLTVVCKVTCPLSKSEARVYLIMLQTTFLFSYVNRAVLMPTCPHFRKGVRLPFIQTTVK